ncbi:hypothetical protein ITP53_16995 [Nonomuraea sp. K274]|uniref:Uncharacterized protein n=1 Tax=Nonomuraea cypriaca TaxID=1187855 RepID=A0A931F0R3_9ACTN|nr:hypothetical protein [Nonomuraea cypriaca]MBF8187401.1 hypothetical protein [Nonomuraea cypriaca]
MKRLVAVPPHVARHKIRDIRSADHPKPPADPKVIDLRAYTGKNVILFPGPTSAA